jgi:hypothetical protein
MEAKSNPQTKKTAILSMKEKFSANGHNMGTKSNI